MTFISKRIVCYAFDAAPLIIANIDTPAKCEETHSTVYEYLFRYSAACESFVRDRLFSRLENEYREGYSVAFSRYIPYRYKLTIVETFFKDNVCSYLIKSKLLRAEQIIDSGFDSVVFFDEKIVPPSLLCKRIVRKGKLMILDASGKPKDIISQTEMY